MVFCPALVRRVYRGRAGLRRAFGDPERRMNGARRKRSPLPFDAQVQMADRRLTLLVGPFDAYQVMARPGETMFRHGITVLCVLLDVAVRFHSDLCTPIAEVP